MIEVKTAIGGFRFTSPLTAAEVIRETYAVAPIPIIWEADTPEKDQAVMRALCVMYGVPYRTAEECEIETYGGTADRPTHMFGSIVFPPTNYLD